MKKIMASIATLALATLSAPAFLYINWSTPAGFTLADGTTPLMPNPQTALIQLIYSPDAIAGDAQIGGSALGDTVLDERTISEASVGDAWAFGFSEVYGPAANQIGFVYIRVFQGGTSIGSVPLGSYYFTGPTFATVDNPAGATPPNNVTAGDVGTGDGDFGTFRLTQQVVPEPSVLALAALGAAVVAVRRFRRS